MSHTKVQEILKTKNFSYKSVQSLKPLTLEEKKKRVKYCRKMLKRKGISLSDAHKKKTWSSGTKKVKITPKYDTKLNCWGAISYHGASSLHIYQGTLKAQTHRDILEEHIEELNNVCPDGY